LVALEVLLIDVAIQRAAAYKDLRTAVNGLAYFSACVVPFAVEYVVVRSLRFFGNTVN